MKKKEHRLSFNKSIGLIVLSVLVVSGSVFLLLLYLGHLKHKYGEDERYQIRSFVQSCSSQDELSNTLLATILDLYLDSFPNLYRFNCREAERKLSRSSVIAVVYITRIKPSSLLVEYTMRKPIALLADYQNTAIDEQGMLFPFAPFYSIKPLPEIYLGETGFAESYPEALSEKTIWGKQLSGCYITLAIDCLNIFRKKEVVENIRLQRIDVSQAFASSCGQRQIVATVEEERMTAQGHEFYPRLLRLNPQDYPLAITHYLRLHSYLPKGEQRDGFFPTVILDLRIPHLAYISKPN